MKNTLQGKLGINIPKYIIPGTWNTPFAYAALHAVTNPRLKAVAWKIREKPENVMGRI